MLIEESTAPLTERLLIRWVQLSDGSKEPHRALMGEEVQEPDKLPMQATRGGGDCGQETLVLLVVILPMICHLALCSIDEHAIWILRMA